MLGPSFIRKARLLKLLERLPGAVYQYRQWENGRCVFPWTSRSIEEILFSSPADLAKDGLLAWRNLCPEFAEPVREAWTHSAKTLSECTFTFQVRSPQDRLHWIRNQAVPERLRDGSTLWHGRMENITLQIETEEAAKQKAALLNVMFENLPDQIYYMDRDSRILGVNPACCRYHGRTAEEMTGKTDRDLYPSELGEKLYREEQALMAGEKMIRERERHVRDDGSILYLESVKSPLYSPSGRVIGLAGISRDITRQVLHEEALVRAKLDAEQSTSFIRAIFDNLEDQFYYKDRQSKVLGGNRAWVKNRGAASIEELIGKTDLELHPAPLGQQLFDNEQRQMRSGETTRIRERHIRADGRVEYIESVKCPMRNEKGEVIGLAGISREITRQVENERQLIEAQQAAEAANKAKSSFLAMMSHEIRTPMNGVIGAASLLMGMDLTPQQEEFVRTIEVSGENLLTIINDILDYSKIEAGKIELEQEPFDLRECIEDAFDLFVQAAAKKRIELLFYIEPDVPAALIGDTTRLRQILVNLIGNAVKFTENGEVRLTAQTLTIDEINQTCHLQLAVRDTGVGISDEHKDLLFEAFTQADLSSTRKYGGTGLGLTISRKLTERMGGKIWFESKKGEGSTFFFTVSLPVSSRPGTKAPPLPVESLRGKHALIVDDNETNRWLLSDQLAQWGMISESFAEPEKAIAHLTSGTRYDIALVDFQMPGMNGATLAKEIHRISGSAPLPVIILSSSCEPVPEDPSISARLSKPVKVNRLCKQILLTLSETRTETLAGKNTIAKVSSDRLSALRVLAAEDNAINQRIIKMMLDRLGCSDAVLVADGEEAVAAVLDAPYDVILMDVQMPRMTGIEAALRIREHTGQADTPWIIALTAGVMQEEQSAALDAGMNEFLAKPLSLDQLEAALSRAADRSVPSTAPLPAG
jgi:two-component system sensor histidine kinase/response regulator